jgi:hypothetical protein
MSLFWAFTRIDLPLTDLEDGPDHPYVSTLLPQSLADSTIFLPLCLIHEEREGGASAINFTALEGRTSVRLDSSEEGFYGARKHIT